MNDKKLLNKKIQEMKRQVIQELEDQYFTVLTPEIAPRFIMKNQIEYKIIPPSLKRNGPRTFILDNTIFKGRAERELLNRAKSEWKEVYINFADDIHNIYNFNGVDYEFYNRVYYIGDPEDKKEPNAYLEETIDKHVSPETFDSFGGLYSFSKL